MEYAASVASSRDPADVRKIDWRFYLPVCLAIIFGALIIAIVEDSPALRLILRGWADAALVLGGALIGLTGIVLEEIYRGGPERVRVAQEREADRLRHQEERRLDFTEYRKLQAALRETQSRAERLQAKLGLTGVLDRDRVGNAVLLGFYFDRRDEPIAATNERTIFETAAQQLKLPAEPFELMKVDRMATHDLLSMAYGANVAEAFDFGYLLSRLDAGGFPDNCTPETLAQLERQLKRLGDDSELHSAVAKFLRYCRSRERERASGTGVLRRVARWIYSVSNGWYEGGRRKK